MAERSARVGLVTVTYNSAEVIDGFLRSTLAQSHRDFVLYIIDNASRDGTLDRLRACDDPRLVLIANAENMGVAAGNNQGIRASLAAGCSHVLLINNDTEFGRGLLEGLLAGLARHRCRIAVPKMMYFDDPERIWFAGGRFVRWKLYANVHIGEHELDRGQYDTPRRIQYAPTCCMLVEASVFETVGMMDERYFVYFDDTDFCFRALQSGVSMYLLPDQVLFHKVSSLTGGQESDFAIQYGARNRVYYVRKHLPVFTVPAICYMLGRTVGRGLSGRYGAKQVKIALSSLRDGLGMPLPRRAAP